MGSLCGGMMIYPNDRHEPLGSFFLLCLASVYQTPLPPLFLGSIYLCSLFLRVSEQL